MLPLTLEAAPEPSVLEPDQSAECQLRAPAEDDEILAAWVEVAEQRGDAFDRGEETASPASEVIARLRARIAGLSSQ